MSIKDGGVAFPANEKDSAGGHFYSHLGMTLRDYFAAQALVSMGTWCPGASSNISYADGMEARARWAYGQADAMIAERRCDRR